METKFGKCELYILYLFCTELQIIIYPFSKVNFKKNSSLLCFELLIVAHASSSYFFSFILSSAFSITKSFVFIELITQKGRSKDASVTKRIKKISAVTKVSIFLTPYICIPYFTRLLYNSFQKDLLNSFNRVFVTSLSF